MSWIQTYNNRAFYPEFPNSIKISKETIAVVLSRLARFGGHTKEFYSVAQHSIHVCRLVKTPELKLPALLHDAHEAYTGFGDVCSPVKRYAPKFIELERNIDCVIADKFGFDHNLFYEEEIKHADLVMCSTEKKFLMGPEPIPWIDMPEPLPIMPVLSLDSTGDVMPSDQEFLFLMKELLNENSK